MFKIGEFSKIAQVSGHLLRHYDEIGLLKPAKIDEWTGYRYYSSQQLPRLNRILALRELGLSLEQIGRMLDDNISAEEIRGMYGLRKAQIEQSIREDLRRLTHIESRLQHIEVGKQAESYEVVVKAVPEQLLLGTRSQFGSFDEARHLIGEMQKRLPELVGLKRLGHLTALLHSDSYGEDLIDLEMGFLLNEPVEEELTLGNGRLLSQRMLPQIDMMATAVRVGAPENAFNCRAVLATWVETNGYVFSGNGRELFLVPPRPGREEETVMEIQYPIARLEMNRHQLIATT